MCRRARRCSPTIERGAYEQLGPLVGSVVAISLVLPLTAILLLGRRLR